MYSIILTVYNCDQFLHSAINSVLNQTYKDFELVIVNDCSTDNSLDIIKSFNDNRIKLINNNQNYGCGISRQIGIDNSNGEYTLFLDGDDTITEDCLEVLHTNTVNNPDIIIFGLIHKDKILYSKYSLLTNKLIKKSMWDNIKYCPLRLCEDKATLYRLLSITDNIIKIDNVLYNYIDRSDSISNSNRNKRIIYSILAIIENINWAKNNKIKFNKNKYYNIYNNLQVKLLFNILDKDNIEEYLEQYNIIKYYVNSIKNNFYLWKN